MMMIVPSGGCNYCTLTIDTGEREEGRLCDTATTIASVSTPTSLLTFRIAPFRRVVGDGRRRVAACLLLLLLILLILLLVISIWIS